MLDPAGTFTFTCINFSGAVTFTYSVSDASQTADDVTICVTPSTMRLSRRLMRSRLTKTLFSSTAAGLNITNNDSDVEGDTLTVVVVDSTTNGTLSFVGNDFTYTPNLNYEGADSFTYFVTDGSDASNTVTVSITVNPINDPPVATFTTDQILDEGGALFNGQTTFDDPDGRCDHASGKPAISGFS